MRHICFFFSHVKHQPKVSGIYALNNHYALSLSSVTDIGRHEASCLGILGIKLVLSLCCNPFSNR